MNDKKYIKYGVRLANPAGVMDRYSNRLIKLIKRMNEDMENGLHSIFYDNSNFVMDINDNDSMSIDSKIQILSNYILNKWLKVFQKKSPSYSKDMTKESNITSRVSVKKSIDKLKEGFKKIEVNKKNITIKGNFLSSDLKRLSRDIISENIDLINKIPGEYVNNFKKPKVKEKMIEAISKSDLHSLNEIIRINSKRSERRAELMAEDQVRKSFNAINKVRLQENGVNKYEWIHSYGGQFPRELHIEYDGQIFSFDDPPIIEESTGEIGIPGQAINCRCTMNPIIEIEV